MDKIANYKDIIYKEASSKQEDSNNTRKNVASGAVGAGMVHSSKDKLLGQKTLYHGTSDKNWESIKKEGLKADKGGSGAASFVDNQYFMENSKNKVHVTGSKLKARMYSGLEKATKKVDMDNIENVSGLFKEVFKKENKGKIAKIKMNYDKYKSMEIDPDEVGGGIMEAIGGKLKSQRAKKMLEPIARHQAARGSMDVGKDEIVGLHKTSKRLKNQMKYLPKYIKNNKARFGTGVALAGTGTALVGNAIKNTVDREK